MKNPLSNIALKSVVSSLIRRTKYFIRYILNPIIKQRDVNEQSKSISDPTIDKKKTKKKIVKKEKEISDIGF